MATNNDGNLLDSAGNVFVDFVWGNVPMQPNDDRANFDYTATKADIAVEVVAADADQNNQWSGYSVYPSARLNPKVGPHAIAEAKYAGFPAFTGNDDGAMISKVEYIVVPSVIGAALAVAKDTLRDAGYEIGNITTATAATNAAKTVTAVQRASGGVAVLTASGAGAAYPVGSQVTIADVDATVNGTWTVMDSSTNSISLATTTKTVLSATGLTGSVVGVAGTIKTQSVAAGAASVPTTGTITITPWAAAS